ncbi:MAG TPA: hypothetical protein VIJ14_08815, partial [Rhabdochlamydiaceae bacterium]
MTTPTTLGTGGHVSPVLGRTHVDPSVTVTAPAPVGVGAVATSTITPVVDPAAATAAAAAPVAQEGFISTAWTYVKGAVVGVYDRIVNLLSSIWSAITGCFTRAPA